MTEYVVYEDRLIRIIRKLEHYEIFVDSMFWSTAESWSEEDEEVDEIYKLYGHKNREEIYVL